jgi:hypothetical protein
MKSSHILCKVDDLNQAVRDYESLGFTVQWGNAPEKAINALIWFEQGPFIELILASKAGPPALMNWLLKTFAPNGMVKRFTGWRAQLEGWCEIALETHDTDVQPEVDSLRTEGMKIFGPVTNQRTPPGGETIHTQTAFPHNPRLPILMGVYQPNPRPRRIIHPNGATGVHTITVGVENELRAEWEKLLDRDDPWMKLTGGKPGVHSVSLTGLKEELPLALSHGAIILPAGT